MDFTFISFKLVFNLNGFQENAVTTELSELADFLSNSRDYQIGPLDQADLEKARDSTFIYSMDYEKPFPQTLFMDSSSVPIDDACVSESVDLAAELPNSISEYRASVVFRMKLSKQCAF